MTLKIAHRQIARPFGQFSSAALGWLAFALQALVGCSSSNSGSPQTARRDDAGAGASYEAGAEAGGGAAGQGGDRSVVDGSNGGAVPEGGQDSGPDAAAGAPDGSFTPAPHSSFPQVTAHGGPVIQKVDLIPVYFGVDALQADLERFNAWVVTSDYWKTIGSDYGVLPGQHEPAVAFVSAPAASMTDTQVASWIDARVADGMLPKPTAGTLFALFFQKGTTITTTSGGRSATSCAEFASLHGSVAMSNSVFTGNVPFVIIPRCSFSTGDELEIATDVATHEYIEAATNPFNAQPAWYLDGKPSQPLEAWQMLNGLEVADLCENQSYDVIDGFTVQDSWSNSAAQAGNNPCQPSDPKHPFFMVSAEDTIYHAQAGATVTVKGVAWSNMPAPDWELGINWGYTPDSNFDGHATLSRTTVNNGDQVTVSVTVPAAPPTAGGRSVYRFTIDSIDPINPNFYHPWPVMIVVP